MHFVKQKQVLCGNKFLFIVTFYTDLKRAKQLLINLFQVADIIFNLFVYNRKYLTDF